MRAGEAVIKLVSMGYHFELIGGKVRYEWQGPGDPDAGQVAPLLSLVRQHKNEVREFLRCYCPDCGGVCFGTFADGLERCLGCYYQALAALNPGLELRH